MSAISIRPALASDAVEAADLLRRSIIELCLPDHGNDAERLEHWLSNKTPKHFLKWIEDYRAHCPSVLLSVFSDGILFSLLTTIF